MHPDRKGSHYSPYQGRTGTGRHLPVADHANDEYTVRRSRPDINELCYYLLINQGLMLTLVGNGS